MLTFTFEVTLEEILRDPERYVDAVFSCLESEFLIMPKISYYAQRNIARIKLACRAWVDSYRGKHSALP